jgi:hypothetical protein
MKLLSLGDINKNIIPIIVGCIICFLSRLSIRFSEDSELFNHPIISNILVQFSYIFTFIPFLIFKYRTNNKHIKNNYLEDITQKNITKGKWLYIFLYNFIDIIQSIFFLYLIELKSNFWILDICFTCIFYYLIFKIKLYKHHYLSLILIIILGIILDLICESLQDDITKNFGIVLLKLLRETIYSSNYALVKYLFEKKFFSIYEISLSNGILGLFFLIILSIFDHYFFKYDDFSKYFDKFNIKELLVMIILMITQLGLYLLKIFQLFPHLMSVNFQLFE